MALKVSRTDWLNAGLKRFGSAGQAGLKVEAMARELGSSKAGFYWYFKSRAAFERALFDHWRQKQTREIIAAAESVKTPAEKFSKLFEQANVRRSGDFLFHLRRLAQKRKTLARLLNQVEAERLGYLASVLEKFGKSPGDAARAAEAVYHLYLGWYERYQFRANDRQQARALFAAASALTGIDLKPSTKEKP